MVALILKNTVSPQFIMFKIVTGMSSWLLWKLYSSVLSDLFWAKVYREGIDQGNYCGQHYMTA